VRAYKIERRSVGWLYASNGWNSSTVSACGSRSGSRGYTRSYVDAVVLNVGFSLRDPGALLVHDTQLLDGSKGREHAADLELGNMAVMMQPQQQWAHTTRTRSM